MKKGGLGTDAEVSPPPCTHAGVVLCRCLSAAEGHGRLCLPGGISAGYQGPLFAVLAFSSIPIFLRAGETKVPP